MTVIAVEEVAKKDLELSMLRELVNHHKVQLTKLQGVHEVVVDAATTSKNLATVAFDLTKALQIPGPLASTTMQTDSSNGSATPMANGVQEQEAIYDIITDEPTPESVSARATALGFSVHTACVPNEENPVVLVCVNDRVEFVPKV
eukprot:9184807-Heterocapsa_arctica.AAC.1